MSISVTVSSYFRNLSLIPYFLTNNFILEFLYRVI